MNLQIIHLDHDIVVIDKPSMLLSVPGRGADKQDSVVSRLAGHFGFAREVHRLDWETSGVLVVALNADAHRALSRQFQDREVEKHYLAVVYGEIEGQTGSVALPLRCDWPNRPRQIVNTQQGKSALTHWQLLASEGGCSRLWLHPITGRSHQLRVHMQAIGHPILGDGLYAHRTALAMAPRLLLHASSLTISHPSSGDRLCFESPTPF